MSMGERIVVGIVMLRCGSEGKSCRELAWRYPGICGVPSGIVLR